MYMDSQSILSYNIAEVPILTWGMVGVTTLVLAYISITDTGGEEPKSSP